MKSGWARLKNIYCKFSIYAFDSNANFLQRKDSVEYLLYFQKCKGEKIVFSFESSIKIGVFSCVQILKYIFDLGQLHMRRPK